MINKIGIGGSGYFTNPIEGLPSHSDHQIILLYLHLWSRIETLGRILNLLVDIERAVGCTPMAGFAIFPLPAKKVLWKARSAEAWGKEFDLGLRARELFGLATDGQVMKVKFEYGRMNVIVADWESWYAEMDGFGSLVMITASLL